jgi:uncharacterized protein (TIGR02265 family)
VRSSAPPRFLTQADLALVGDVDFEAMIGAIPEAYTVKGMFFTRYVNALEAEWERLEGTLRAPAKYGRYHAFEDYPMHDYLRIFDRIARERFPGSIREAYRLLARGEVEVFSESTLGKVTFSLLREPGAALLRYPYLMSVVTRGPRLSAERRGPRRVAVTHDHYAGAFEQGLGVVEGLVLAFDEAPQVEVVVDDQRNATFDVTW